MPLSFFEYFLFFSTFVFQFVESSVRIEITAPVNPVDENGILSIHCQVWDLNQNSHVIISADAKPLTMGETMLQGVEDRYFLAVRQFTDGSSVYFLSIMDVTKKDMGLYSCKVVESEGAEFRTLGYESIPINVAYFPGVTDPVCNPQGEKKFYEGAELRLNCSSEKAIPTVDIHWSRSTEEDDNLRVQKSEHSGRIYGIHTLRVTRKHQRALFVCKITSKAFPLETQTCHVGPITVMYRTGDTTFPPIGQFDQDLSELPYDMPAIETIGPVRGPDSASCTEICATEDSYTFYWVVATIVTCLIALVFLIIAIVMFIRYWNLPTYTKPKYVIPPQRPSEEIYVDLEGRPRSKNSVYMTLEKIKCPNDRMIHAGGEMWHFYYKQNDFSALYYNSLVYD